MNDWKNDNRLSIGGKMKTRLFALTITMTFLMGAATAEAAIRVVSTKGQCAYKKGRAWAPLRAGIVIPVGSKVSTGVRSQAILVVDNHKVTIKALTMMKIYENSAKKSERTTRLGLRRGSIRAKVSRSKRIKTTFKVSTPVATSSVRGTEEEISYGPNSGMVIRVIESSVWGENKNGLKKLITGRLRYHQKSDKSEPEPLIYRLKDGSFVVIYDKNVTMDEKDSHRTHGDEQIENSEDPASIVDKQTTTQVNLNLQFP